MSELRKEKRCSSQFPVVFKGIAVYEQFSNKKRRQFNLTPLNTYLRLLISRQSGVIYDRIYIVVSLSPYVNSQFNLLIVDFSCVINAIKYVLKDNMDDNLLTVEEVADKLRLTKSTVWTKAKTGQLPGFKIGKRWLFKSSDISTYIKKRKRLYEL